MPPTAEAAQASLERFKAARPAFEDAAEELEKLLLRVLHDLGTQGNTSVRVKSTTSFRRKILQRGYADPWTETTDMIGGRVVLPSIGDVDRVTAALKIRFPDAIIEDKRITTDPAKLQYSGVHLTTKLPGELASGDAQTVYAEIQVRTIAQDAWSVVSHSVVYKPDVPLSPTDQHVVYRLVALAEIFDEEVKRVMEAMASQPGYELVPLLRLVDKAAGEVGMLNDDRETSLTVLSALAPLVSDLENYAATLASFVANQRERLEWLVETRGPSSESGDLWSNTLVGQPEALMITERLTIEPNAVLQNWNDAGLPHELLTPFLNLVGVANDE